MPRVSPFFSPAEAKPTSCLLNITHDSYRYETFELLLTNTFLKLLQTVAGCQKEPSVGITGAGFFMGWISFLAPNLSKH